jgi:cation diffusion facilitator CzcD-associated flavoprotein CzcO
VKRAKLRVAIIGAGFSGLCMGAALRRAGIDRFQIFEKASSVGGTWRENVYPGSGCDVPSHLYCYSFAPNPHFSRAFAGQGEILSYLERFADEQGLSPHLRFDTEVTSARFDAERTVWSLTLKSGEVAEADVVVTATGQLNRPHRPEIRGLADFAGAMFHSAEWRVGHDLRGRRVAVIGSGATAVQIIPSVAPLVERLYLFQRTPSWVIPKADHAYPAAVRRAFERVPGLLKLNRYLIYWLLEPRFVAFSKGSRFGEFFERYARQWMEQEVTDPDLRRKLIPDYPPGCKRILISSEYLSALQRREVEVVTDPIERVTRDAVVTRDGRSRAVDTIVLATGFDATNFLAPMSIEGLDGVRLEDAWRHGAEAHLGMAVSGFPNFFMLYGPNTNLGHNSIVFMVECQTRYVARLIEELSKDQVRYLDVSRDSMNRFNQAIQEKLSRTVWNANCTNWYTTAEGKQTNNWPYFTLDYWWRTREPNFEDFVRSVAPLGGSRSGEGFGAREEPLCAAEED